MVPILLLIHASEMQTTSAMIMRICQLYLETASCYSGGASAEGE